jgi:light-regulated signal transduction histidine kinase (bacteriophytochrome)
VVEDQKLAEEQIRRLNDELEQRVKDRTAQLETANQELEAFAYSVSHDLRAPLRAMDGFSAALLSGYSDNLDEQGRHYLNRVQEASRRMSQLINDLLNLSRVTRRELSRQNVDLSELAREVSREMRSPNTGRLVIFDIAPGLTAQADSHLMKIVLENLMGNAYKFTSKHEEAHVQFGMENRNGERVFYVRDNGVGFDMQYAAKLFAPFQRLHGMQEYPGTGIGLVTVQRIIHRHGGRIWPEAELDRGATFYFTLGDAR